jgi:DNA modification methylase
MTLPPVLLAGDCLDVLRTFDDNQFDAIVTDPPYGLEFMGKDWDSFKTGGKQPKIGDADGSPHRRNTGTPSWAASGNPRCLNCGGTKYDRARPTGCACSSPLFPVESAAPNRAFQEWCTGWAAECLRVLKPGGHLLAFGSPRTYHRLTSGIEDAGFEIRDSISWLYGTGFPKSLDVSKAIDKAAGVERKVVAEGKAAKRMIPGADQARTGSWIKDNGREFVPTVTAPATDAARQWQGWGTALKPGHEPIVVARKPLGGTVAANVQAHRTGALNIDGCRVEGEDAPAGRLRHGGGSAHSDSMSGPLNPDVRPASPAGRWPANVVLDEDAAAELDAQTGTLTSGKLAAHHARRPKGAGILGAFGSVEGERGFGDSGGASRFFYCAKAPAAERPKVDGQGHPTVKPLALMRWLVRLVTPPGGVVLDPFAGSGTTLQAARDEGFWAFGIERDPTYLPLIRARLGLPDPVDEVAS